MGRDGPGCCGLRLPRALAVFPAAVPGWILREDLEATHLAPYVDVLVVSSDLG
ncbi:MAG: hypothetical protein AB1445_11165 [Bacillota bacterium]